MALIEAEKEVTARLTDAVVAQLNPIDVMLRTMRVAVKSGHGPLALAAATAVAPYLYPKMANVPVESRVRRTMLDFSDSELDLIASGRMPAPTIEGGEGEK